MKPATFVAVVLLCATGFCAAQDRPTTLPRAPFHLDARPWRPLNTPRDAYLDCVEGICRFTTKHLGPSGEVIDPFLKREHQYSTPYFAFAIGSIDVNADSTADASFSAPCQFMLQLREGKVLAVEVDRDVVATIAGRQIELASHTPLKL